MRNLTIFLALLLCLFASKLNAQKSFEDRAKVIADKIEKITKDEKAALKKEVEEVNVELEKGKITKEEADRKKSALAEAAAANIETKVNKTKEELDVLVQETADGKLKSTGNHTGGGYYELRYVKVNDSVRKATSEPRTTTQLLLCFGLSNLLSKGSFNFSDFSGLPGALEFGLLRNTRLSKTDNLLHLTYGLSYMWNNIYLKTERYFILSGNQTILATYPINLKKNQSFFEYSYVVLPLHLEFDFTKPKKDNAGNTIFRTHESRRFGLGGYVGYNVHSKQELGYDKDGHDIIEKQKGNWNVNDWNYGISTYFGYKHTSLYIKYDLNTLFKYNTEKQNNLFIGYRLELR